MRDAQPLISIVVPSYNHAHLLHRALHAIKDQTYQHWEATVVDNYSLDNTAEVIAGFRDERIRHVKFHNGGVIAASRNVGVRESKGEWIAFLDSDDWWTSDKLQKCLDRAGPDTQLLYHDMTIVGLKALGLFKRKMQSRRLDQSATIDLLVNGNPIATSSVMVRKASLEQVGGMTEDPGMTAAEDYHTWLLISQLPGRFEYINTNLGFYLVHAQGVSQKDMSRPMRKVMARFRTLLDGRQRRVAFGRVAYARARFLFLAGRRLSLGRYLSYCLRFGDVEIRAKALAMMLVKHLKKAAK